MPKIVVVEESSELRRAVEGALRAAGHEVVGERSGRGAIVRLESEAPDLVIAGLALGDVNGLQVCAFVKQSPILSATPVLLLDSGGEADGQRQAKRAGAAGLVTLPMDAATLVGEVGRLLGASAPPPDPDGGDGSAGDETVLEAPPAEVVSGALPFPGPPTSADDFDFAAFDDLPSVDLTAAEPAAPALPEALPEEPALDAPIFEDSELETPTFELAELEPPIFEPVALDAPIFEPVALDSPAFFEAPPFPEPPFPEPPPIEAAAPGPAAAEPGAEPAVVVPEPSVAEPPAESETTRRFSDLLDELATALDLRFGALLHTSDGAVRRLGEVPRLETTIGADVIRMALLASAVSAQVGQGKLQNVILESGDGTVLVQRLPENHLLVLGFADASALGKARYLVRKVRERLGAANGA